MKSTLLALALLLAPLAGCAHNLQADYVDQMEATYEAVLLDVRDGLYKPDANSQATLDRWRDSNAAARRVLESK